MHRTRKLVMGACEVKGCEEFREEVLRVALFVRFEHVEALADALLVSLAEKKVLDV